jgi:hypothetical protein
MEKRLSVFFLRGNFGFYVWTDINLPLNPNPPTFIISSQIPMDVSFSHMVVGSIALLERDSIFFLQVRFESISMNSSIMV